MPSNLTLFFSDETGHEQEIAVQTNPFTIGRQEGNELVIPDASLSRRHALITFFNGVAQITDCGSQNGTFLNGRPVGGNAVLKNGDVITVGHNCKLRVRLAENKEKAAAVSDKPVAAPAPVNDLPVTPVPETSTTSSQLSPAMMAVLATGAIIVIAGVLILRAAHRRR